MIGIDVDGYWVYELDGKTENLMTVDGQPAPALSSAGKGTFTPQFRVGGKTSGRFLITVLNGCK